MRVLRALAAKLAAAQTLTIDVSTYRANIGCSFGLSTTGAVTQDGFRKLPCQNPRPRTARRRRHGSLDSKQLHEMRVQQLIARCAEILLAAMVVTVAAMVIIGMHDGGRGQHSG